MTFAVASCHKNISTHKNIDTSTAELPAAETNKNGFTSATVIYLTLDGCAWMLKLKDGKYLQPYTLAPEFQKENLKVLIKYTLSKNQTSVCMSGSIVNITEIKLNE